MKVLVKIGDIVSTESLARFDFCVPISLHGAIFIKLTELQIKDMEYSLLMAVDQYNVNIIKISTDLANEYPNITSLATIGITKEFIGFKKSADGLVHLLDEVFRRQNTISSYGFSSIHEFNKNAFEPLPQLIVLMSSVLACFRMGKSSIGIDQLFDIIKNGANLGVCFLFINTQLEEASVDDEEYLEFSRALKSKNPSLILIDGLVDASKLHPVFQKISAKHPRFLIDLLVSKPEENRALAKVLIDRSSEHNDVVSSDFLRVVVGERKDGTPHYLSLGKSSGAYHAAVSGAVGSGKTTFLRNLILNIALQKTDEEINIHFIDLKRAMGSNIFLQYPVKIITGILEVEPDFSVAHRLIERYHGIIKERFDRLRESQVDEIDAFNNKSKQKMPHIIAIIDEAHKLFALTDSVSANLKLGDRIQLLLQESRAAGVHFIFCSHNFNRTGFTDVTREQVKVRVAFKLGSAIASQSFIGSDQAFSLKNSPSKGVYKFIYNDDSGYQESNVEVVAKQYIDSAFIESLKSVSDSSHITAVIDAAYAAPLQENSINLKGSNLDDSDLDEIRKDLHEKMKIFG